jgi:hypothetical protein
VTFTFYLTIFGRLLVWFTLFLALIKTGCVDRRGDRRLQVLTNVGFVVLAAAFTTYSLYLLHLMLQGG